MGRLKRNNKSATDTELLAISSRVFSHACSETFGPQPGKRQEPTVVNLFVDSFIPRCHVITWPPRDRFQPNFGSANKNFLGSLELFILITRPNHRRWVPRMIWFSLLDDLGSKYKALNFVISYRLFPRKVSDRAKASMVKYLRSV